MIAFSAYQLNLAPYIVAKHFEIPATGTVMVTDRMAAPLLEPSNQKWLA